MKLNIHLEFFAMRKDSSTEKTKCQVFYIARDIGEKWGNKQNHPIKIDPLFT